MGFAYIFGLNPQEERERDREMLTCIACSKQLNTKNGGSKEEDDRVLGTPRPKQTIKSLTSQVDKSLFFIYVTFTNCFFFFFLRQNHV